jgi:hypothetical protein
MWGKHPLGTLGTTLSNRLPESAYSIEAVWHVAFETQNGLIGTSSVNFGFSKKSLASRRKGTLLGRESMHQQVSHG